MDPIETEGVAQQPLFLEQSQPRPPQDALSFQARSSHEGRIVREFAQDALAESGFSLTSAQFEVATIGVEVDFAADDRLGSRWYCEVTGAYGSRRPGLQRTDTVRKLLGSAYLLADWNVRPFLVITTDLPKPGSRGDVWIKHAGPRIIYDIVVLGKSHDLHRLRHYAREGVDSGPLPGWWSPEELAGRRGIADKQLSLAGTGDDEGRSGVISRSHSIRIVMPSRNSIGHPIDPVVLAAFQKDIVGWLMQRNGGQVKQTGEGSWLDENGAPMDERITILESWGDVPVSKEEIQPFVDRMFTDLDQLAATIFMDGEMLLFSRIPIESPAEADPDRSLLD